MLSIVVWFIVVTIYARSYVETLLRYVVEYLVLHVDHLGFGLREGFGQKRKETVYVL